MELYNLTYNLELIPHEQEATKKQANSSLAKKNEERNQTLLHSNKANSSLLTQKSHLQPS